MKKIFLLLFLSFFIHTYSQTLEGTVYDENKIPIKGVNVYLDGTTIMTSTDENGKYTLNLRAKINTALVISLMGYETVSITDPYEKGNIKTYLVPKIFELNEVVIRKELFNRKQKLNIFRKQFLGTSKAGRSCIITNENIIDFDYDYEKNILNASASAPIKVTNNHLGYDIEFDLQEFYIKFYKTSIYSSDVTKILFMGTSFFKEIEKGEKINKFRENTYQGSQMNFLKNLSNNDWAKDKFLLFKKSLPANPENYFRITDKAHLKKIILLQDDVKTDVTLNNPKFKLTLTVLYKNREKSMVTFLADTFYIDQFGNVYNPREIAFIGTMGEERLGDMLPMSYSNQINN